jgi:tetratricopeptide (TPR) repeat protein
MLYYRFPLFFAVGTICVSLTYGNGLAIALESQKLESIVQTVDNVDTSNKATNPTEGLDYESLMQAGYTADKNRDYLTALAHFQKALALRPDDSSAQQAVRNVTSYAFDNYMQAGYTADRNRDYQTALENFQKAQQIRPDSFYAQQAANNITNYLATSVEPNKSDRTSRSQNDLNFSLMLLGLVASIGVAIGVLFLLLKKPNLPEENTATKEHKQAGESLQPIPSRLENNSKELKPDTAIANSELPPRKADAPMEKINNKDTARDNLPPKPSTASKGLNLDRLAPIGQQTEEESFLIPPSTSISKLDIVPELIQDLQRGDRATRHKSIWELAQKADSRAMKPLVELMVDANSQEQSLILEAMTQIVSRTLKPMNQAFMLSLENKNSQVRQNAIRDLTTVYELMSQVTRRLTRAVEDSDAEVQETAKWALKQLEQMAPVSWERETAEQNTSNASDN